MKNLNFLLQVRKSWIAYFWYNKEENGERRKILAHVIFGKDMRNFLKMCQTNFEHFFE